MLCHDWLSSKHVVMGTKTGKALLLEDAELRTTVDVWAKIQEIQPEAAAAAAAAAAAGQLQMNVREYMQTDNKKKVPQCLKLVDVNKSQRTSI